MLKLNGKPLLASVLSAPAVIKKALDKSPTDELYTSSELARILGLKRAQVSDSASRLPANYHTIVRKERLWGHPKAIAELRKQVA